MTELMKTPLHDWHVLNDAHLVEFHGWSMPLYYMSMSEEHETTRTKAGLFDLGHMGRIYVRGPRATEFVTKVTPAAVHKASVGDVLYSFVLQEDGGIIDDITVYVGESEHFLVVNAGNRIAVVKHLQELAADFNGVEIEDVSLSVGMMALQGPRAERIMEIMLGATHKPMPYYRWRDVAAQDDLPAFRMSTTGYTGEWGYEFYVNAENAADLWEQILVHGMGEGVFPAGLGARDSLRLEASMPLYGHELDLSVTPVQAGLGKFVNWERPEFVGAAALLAEKAAGPRRKLVGFEFAQRGPLPRQGYPIFAAGGDAPTGIVTSGTLSPTLQKIVGMGFVEAAHHAEGTALEVEIRGRRWPAVVVKRPFYRRKTA